MLWTLDRLSRHVFIPGRMLSALKCTIWGYKKPDKFPRDVQGADLRMEVAEQLYLISIPISPILLEDKPLMRSFTICQRKKPLSRRCLPGRDRHYRRTTCSLSSCPVCFRGVSPYPQVLPALMSFFMGVYVPPEGLLPLSLRITTI